MRNSTVHIYSADLQVSERHRSPGLSHNYLIDYIIGYIVGFIIDFIIDFIIHVDY